MFEPFDFMSEKFNLMLKELTFALGVLHFRVARLCYVPAGLRLIREPFSVMPEPVRFIANKCSLKGDSRATSRIWSSNFFGLPEETAGSTTDLVMRSSVASRSPESNRAIQTLSAFNCSFLGPNSR